MLVTYRGKGAVALTQGNWKNQACLGCKYEKKGSGIIPTNLQSLQPPTLHRTLGGDGKNSLYRSSVRCILLEAGIRNSKKRKAYKHRSGRVRYPGETMLL